MAESGAKRMSSKQPTRDPQVQEQVLEWIRRYQENEDDEAQTHLVMHYERLVQSIARKYSKGNRIMKISLKWAC